MFQGKLEPDVSPVTPLIRLQHARLFLRRKQTNAPIRRAHLTRRRHQTFDPSHLKSLKQGCNIERPDGFCVDRRAMACRLSLIHICGATLAVSLGTRRRALGDVQLI